MSKRNWPIAAVLITAGVVEVPAAFAVCMPTAWMAFVHEKLGMGPFPDQPVVGYLARATSMLYAVHGAILLFVACDVVRYWRLIALLGVLFIVEGAAVLMFGLAERIPIWWTLFDSAALASTGTLLLVLQKVFPAPGKGE